MRVTCVPVWRAQGRASPRWLFAEHGLRRGAWPPSHSLSPSARALDFGYLTQDMIDDYEPALMFTIPRLAIVW